MFAQPRLSRYRPIGLIVPLMSLLAACASYEEPAVVPTAIDPSQRGPVTGIGVDGADIIAMTDQMMRDILANPTLAGSATPPQVIIDSQYFVNDSAQRLNKDLITNRLRVELNRAARGRMIFVGRQYADAVAKERELKRQGQVDIGTTGLTAAQAGADYRLGGQIASLPTRDPQSGLTQQYTQITFEMFDLERGTLVWTNIYEIQRVARDDIVYR